ncbi:MAG: helix-turn-helix transcriptional regulator [Lachnospiraceae bacterium]|nr:helix-turn-helix transcriptional regulator [Lachnospiraceae bacterium]
MAAYTSSNVKKGLLPMLVLHLLNEKDMYGYEIIKAIEERSGGILSFKVGALYPVLYHLEETGHVTETRVPHKMRMTHVIYHLEPIGKTLLREIEEEYYSVSDAVASILEGRNHERAETV